MKHDVVALNFVSCLSVGLSLDILMLWLYSLFAVHALAWTKRGFICSAGDGRQRRSGGDRRGCNGAGQLNTDFYEGISALSYGAK